MGLALKSQAEVLGAAAGGGPFGEGFEAVTVFPGEMKELAGVELGGFLTEQSFKAPLDVRAFPRLETVAARGEPVELQDVPHGRVDILPATSGEESYERGGYSGPSVGSSHSRLTVAEEYEEASLLAHPAIGLVDRTKDESRGERNQEALRSRP
jgi:hypothetical protein